MQLQFSRKKHHFSYERTIILQPLCQMVIVPRITLIFKGISADMRNKVEVTIAGKKVKIACPKGQESALFAAASELNKRVEQLGNSDVINTPEQMMMMVALNLANDLLSVQKAHEEEREENANQIALLQSTIEQALAPHIKSA
jgi:cell division protein ZapA